MLFLMLEETQSCSPHWHLDFKKSRIEHRRIYTSYVKNVFNGDFNLIFGFFDSSRPNNFGTRLRLLKYKVRL